MSAAVDQVPPTFRRGANPGFTGRLLAAQALVLFTGALTTWLVASAVGPEIFHRHIAEAGIVQSGLETDHVDQAFTSALLLSMSVALVTAVAAALAVSWYLSHRVRRSIAPVVNAASDIAAGQFRARVPDPGLGGEFATLSATFNALADRLEAVETTRRRMLADLAHEMRTPLATIEAHLEAIEDGVRVLDEQTMAVIRGSTSRLNRLAEDISAVSRAEEGRLEISPVAADAGALANAAVEGARDRYAGKGVTLRADIRGASRVVADPDRIGQVLGNLLDNALRHTPSGGTVVLRCTSAGGWVEYSVTDSGEGISAEHLPHVFDRFYRVDTARDRAHGGSGIGLSIAKALVEAHGGSIRVTSEGPGRGTTCTVRLRAADR